MRLEEAIVHCREVAADESRGEKCREEHAQFAIWLEELKALREQPKDKLTPTEAVIELDKLKDHSVVGDVERRNAAVSIGIKAIKKSLNREKPARGFLNKAYYCCPGCRQPIALIENLNYKVILPGYCENCGQALDWR